MSDFTAADQSRQLPFCMNDGCSAPGGVRMQKIAINGKLECPNCFSANQPKTGQTIVMEEGNGPAKLRFVKNGEILAATATPPAAAPVSVPPSGVAGCICINVPAELFPDLVVWARKLKLPKDWSEATKLKAIVDFQVHLNAKLQELSR